MSGSAAAGFAQSLSTFPSRVIPMGYSDDFYDFSFHQCTRKVSEFRPQDVCSC
jgi:hypothetical protein